MSRTNNTFTNGQSLTLLHPLLQPHQGVFPHKGPRFASELYIDGPSITPPESSLLLKSAVLS